MNEVAPTKVSTSPGPTASVSEPGLVAEVAQLRSLLMLSLATMLFLVCTLIMFLIYQVSVVRKELETLRPRVAQMRVEYQKEAQVYDNFFKNLLMYSQTRPEFRQILLRYNVIKPSATTTAPGSEPVIPVVTAK